MIKFLKKVLPLLALILNWMPGLVSGQTTTAENLETCLDGRYPSLCKDSLLTSEQRRQVRNAEAAENLKTCMDGRYPSLCKDSLLTSEQRRQVSLATRHTSTDQSGKRTLSTAFSSSWLSLDGDDFINLNTGDYVMGLGGGDYLNLGTGDYFMELGGGDYMNLGTGDYIMDVGGGDRMNLGTGDYIMNLGDGNFLNLGTGDLSIGF